ncbi:hypothetical protein [Prosthecobacter sp.]|uniref:hypothetical protein n=1 Tax=Prosthecobacter sp. TaxID=1965333 RepID=UPI0037852A18
MRFAPAFVQHYFLELDPRYYRDVAQSLEKSYSTECASPSGDAPTAGGPALRIGPWRLFAWLDRPSLWALRSIQRTSGLDTFLFDDHGLPGVTDVAEMINFPFQEAAAEPDGVVATSWAEFEPTMRGSGLLCATFLWPDWDVLTAASWAGPEATKSRILEAIHAVFRQSVMTEFAAPAADSDRGTCGTFAKETRPPRPPLLMMASAGDADLVLYGWVSSAEVLDRYLFLLTRMSVADLHQEIFGAPSQKHGAERSVFRASQTELAVDLGAYEHSMQLAVKTVSPPAQPQAPPPHRFDGTFHAEIGLSRGHGSLAHLRDGVSQVLGGGHPWYERTIFGGEDMILVGENVSFEQIISLQAKLDAALASDPRFVRRTSLRIGIDVSESYGRTATLPLNDPATHSQINDPVGHSCPKVPPDLGVVRAEIERLTKMKWREDVRIIERMVERCVTLQKALHVRLETRHMAATALKNIVRHCDIIRRDEEELQNVKDNHIPPEDRHLRPNLLVQFAEDIRLSRKELLEAGVYLDRALAHHSKGVIPLLLHPASQARGPEHFGSEVGLSVGLGTMFQNAATRLWREMKSAPRPNSEWDESYQQLKEDLQSLRHPTVFASHEPDFGIMPQLGLLRVPRWALWYAPASSHLMHEFGHAVARIGALQYLLTALIADLVHKYDALDEEYWQLRPAVQEATSHCQPTKNLDLRAFARYLERFSPVLLTQGDYMLFFEETACDLVSRLYSYPPEEQWDSVWLEHCLKYVLPFIGRDSPYQIKERIARLQGAYVAVRLMRRAGALHVGAQALTVGQLAAVQAHAAEEAEHFVSSLGMWKQKVMAEPATRHFPSWAVDELLNICSDRENLQYSRQCPELLSKFVHAGWLLCFAMSLPDGDVRTDPSAIKGLMVWRAMLRAGWEHTDESELVEALARCEIPRRRSAFPERLPGLLVSALNQNQSRVEPATRIALSFYLRDLYNLENYE